MFVIYGLIGLIMILSSYFLSNFPAIHHLNFIFSFGYFLFFDAIDFSLTGNSLLHKTSHKKIYILYMILIGALVGLVFDFYGTLISGMWNYSMITNFWLTAELYLDWGIFLLMIYSSYRVFLYLVDKEFGKIGKKLSSKNKESRIFSMFGLFGLLFLVAPFIIYFFTSKYDIISFSLGMFGTWLMCEYVEYRRKETSLIKDLIEGYWDPFIAIVIAGLVTGILWEKLNVSRGAWTYTNIPFSNITVLGIPIVVIIAWPLLYIIFLSFYRAFIKDRDKIW